MEDKHVIIEDLGTLVGHDDQPSSDSFFAVYDGHGPFGNLASNFVMTYVEKYLEEHPSLHANPMKALKKSSCPLVNKMFCTAERLAGASRLLYLLTPYAIATIPIIEGCFYVVHSTN